MARILLNFCGMSLVCAKRFLSGIALAVFLNAEVLAYVIPHVHASKELCREAVDCDDHGDGEPHSHPVEDCATCQFLHLAKDADFVSLGVQSSGEFAHSKLPSWTSIYFVAPPYFLPTPRGPPLLSL